MKDPFEQPKKAAELIDAWVAEHGLLPLIKSDSRFNHTVAIKHKSNREFAFCNSYAVVWEDWLLVISTPNNSQFKLQELEHFDMTDRFSKEAIPISRVLIKNNQVQTVPM